MTLSATAVNHAKPKGKAYKLADGRGLYLLVSPQGHRYWRFNYRYDGKQKTLALGVYPDIGLADAREKREAARKLVAAGEDPGQERQKQEAAAKALEEETFGFLAKEWLERLEREGRSRSTMSKLSWLIDFATPALGERSIREISAPQLLGVLRTIEARGRYETANRLRSTFGTIFRYAIATGRAERDVAADLRGALITPKVNHRPAIVEPKPVGALLRAIDGHDGQPVVRLALQLAPHVFVRPGELRMGEWKEVDFESAIWTIPALRTKMRRPHKVPLSHQTIAILKELKALTGGGALMFPSVRTKDRSMSNNTMNAALRGLGYGKTEMTAHGFRAMASTLLNEMGAWHPDAIERQLAHLDANQVRRAYARGEHWDERVRMMQKWSDYLDGLRASANARQ